MVRVHKLLLLSIFSLFQGIYSYCIYNNLTDGSSFKVTQTESGAPPGRVFKKHMEKYSVFCCPYTQKDCSCLLRNDTEARFSIDFYFASGNPPTKFTRCKAGGALFIHGTQENYHGECIDTDRVSTVVSFEDGEDPFFLKCF